MLYPRETEGGLLVTDEQVVGVREHLAQRHRIFFLSGALQGDMEVHNLLLACDSLSDKPVRIVITSPGGDLDTAFLLYDTFKLLRSPMQIFGRYCASAACLLLAAGEQGCRYLSPHAKVMLHLPSAQAYGDSHDWEIQHTEMKKYKDKMVEILIECGARKSHDAILKDIDRSFWLEPEEAIDYGLCDKIMSPEVLREWLT